jgi:hypothetical protein
MKIVKMVLLALAIAGLLAAQEKPQPAPAETKSGPPLEQRVFQLKYADVRDVANVLDVFGYSIHRNPNLHVLAVSAPHDVMTAIEEAIKRLDVPTAAPKDIDLTVYMVLASEQAGSGNNLPPELQPVANQLKGIFSYKGFRMLDTVLLRTQPGNMARASGVIGTASGSSNTQYNLSVMPTAVTEDPKGRLIRLNNLVLNLRVAPGMDAGINTEITVREGQKVVVGKSSMGAPDQALILVVTAKVAE